MIFRRRPAPSLTLWSAVGPAELRALAELGWTSFPQTGQERDVEAYPVRAHAVRRAREDLVSEHGEGSVIVFDVPPDVREWPGVALDGDRLWVPRGRRLTKALHGEISEEDQYLRPAPAADLDAVRLAFGEPAPQAWRAMVSRPGWLRRGWMLTGAYVDLHPPADAIRVTRQWTAEMVYHPGVLVIGWDGDQRHLAINLAERDPAVHLVGSHSTGWDDTVVQALDVASLVEQLESGTFAWVA